MGALFSKTDYNCLESSSTISKIEHKNLEFHEQIGQGRFGSVHRVTFKKPHCVTYNSRLKNLHKPRDSFVTEAAAKRFFTIHKEVATRGKLSHPYLVELLGFCHMNNGIVLMEYTPNGSLHDYLVQQAEPPPRQLNKKWIQQSAYAIQYLHDEQNLVHMNITAKNCLLFGEDNNLKLSDYGIVWEAAQCHQVENYRYIAPEILNNSNDGDDGTPVFSKPADIYAYGMLVLQILTRKPPFPDTQWQDIVHDVSNGIQPEIPQECPPNLADIMSRCWEAEPEKRPTIQTIVQGMWMDKIYLGPGKKCDRGFHAENLGLGSNHVFQK